MLKEIIKKELTESIKKGDDISVQVLRSILAVIENKEKEKRYKTFKEKKEITEDELIKKSELADEEIVEVISSEIKKRKEAISLYERGKREDLAEKEKKEIEILKKYLPPQLTQEELEKTIKEVIKNTGAKEIKDMGKIMASLVPLVKGKTDMGLVNEMVKKILSEEKKE